jgi:transposase
MAKITRFVGLDVHADTIAVAVAEAGRDGEVRSLGTVPNRPDSVRKLLKKLGAPERLRACYEAGPCGYALYWQLVELGVACDVIAPTLVPVKSGDRVKTDRRDAEKLARNHRAGELTAVWVPDAAHEALRDLVRAREAAKKDQLRARHRLGKFLLRHGRRPPAGHTLWTLKHLTWLKSVSFEQPAQAATLVDYLHEVEHMRERITRLERALDAAIETAPAEMRAIVAALQALRGVAKLTAVTVVAEVGRLSRFEHPKHLMGYGGVVPSEHSSGARTRRGSITKSGNAHLRRVVVEAAWAYRRKPGMYTRLRKAQHGLSEDVKAISWRAQVRLHARYWRLVSRGKKAQQAISAIARELLGFLWAIGVAAEREHAATRSSVKNARARAAAA